MKPWTQVALGIALVGGAFLMLGYFVAQALGWKVTLEGYAFAFTFAAACCGGIGLIVRGTCK